MPNLPHPPPVQYPVSRPPHCRLPPADVRRHAAHGSSFDGTGQPARRRVWVPVRGGGRYPHPLDITLSWDNLEVDRLISAAGEAHFAGYLNALQGKLHAWQDERKLAFGSRTQADPTTLIGVLDFEHLER